MIISVYEWIMKFTVLATFTLIMCVFFVVLRYKKVCTDTLNYKTVDQYY